jgi:hypothetical protein
MLTRIASTPGVASAMSSNVMSGAAFVSSAVSV